MDEQIKTKATVKAFNEIYDLCYSESINDEEEFFKELFQILRSYEFVASLVNEGIG